MDHFYDNSLQTGLMRDLGIDVEVLREHVVLLGNQVGVGPLSRKPQPIFIFRE